jgi:hypothetical protein
MERQFPETSITCAHAGCGRAFGEPTELTVRVNDSMETYSACPYCFTPVDEKKTEDSQASTEATEINVEQVTLDFLREMEILSDADGRYLTQLASKYVSA